MIDAGHIKLFIYTGYMIVSFVCGIMCFIHSRELARQGKNARHALLMGLVFLTIFAGWIGVVLDTGYYRVSVYYRTFFVLAMMMNTVFLYHFVFIITATGGKRAFPVVHYVLAFTVAAIFGLWSATVPAGVRHDIIESDGAIQSGFPFFSVVYIFSPLLFTLYGTFYAVAGLLRARRYRRELVNYPVRMSRTPLKWVYILLFFWIASIPVPIFAMIADISRIPVVFQIVLILLLLKYIVLCANTLAGNYTFITAMYGKSAPVRKPALDHHKIDDYMRSRKPYLNPKLRIVDLCKDLGTNRSYISSYINRTYGINFNRYINGFRLRELADLRSDPSNSHLSIIELIHHAGFNSYRSYIRAKGSEEFI